MFQAGWLASTQFSLFFLLFPLFFFLFLHNRDSGTLTCPFARHTTCWFRIWKNVDPATGAKTNFSARGTHAHNDARETSSDDDVTYSTKEMCSSKGRSPSKWISSSFVNQKDMCCLGASLVDPFYKRNVL